MKKVLTCLLAGFMAVCMMIPSVYASGEPETEAVQEYAEPAEQPAEQTESITEEITEEIPEETATAFELPERFAGMDPDDPMYTVMLERLNTLDGGDWSGTSFASYTPREAAANETVCIGIDVSAWQGSINWKAVKNAGVEFVIIRGAYRGSGTGKIVTDSWFESYIKGAKNAGLLVGVYIFSQAITAAEGREEANYLINLVKNYKIDLPLVLDFEYVDGGRLHKANLSRRAGTDICNAFCDTVEAAGYDSMVYANPSMLSSALYPNELGRLWLAHYTKKTGYSARGYEYWQCGLGSVSGVSGDADLDFWFRPTTDPDVFSDVTKDDWFRDSVMSAYDAGVVKGTSDTEFSPYDSATRGQVITMLYRQQKSPAFTGTTDFTDLTADYYQTPIAWAVSCGVTKGTSENTFSPDDTITRQDLATMLWRLAGSPSSTGDLTLFSDKDDIRPYAAEAMAWAVEKNILKGYDDGTVAPAGQANRAEVCAMLMRFDALS